MSFGEYLEKLIRDRDLSINQLTKQCDINRGGLYSVFKNQRHLTTDQLFALISKLALTSIEESKLKELYFKEIYGKEEYEKINFLIEQIQNCIPNGKRETKKSRDESDAIKKLKAFIKNNYRVITNFPFSYEDADDLFYNAVKCGEITEFIHILALEEKDNYIHNYSAVFKSIKYMIFQQFPFYFYTALQSLKSSSLMPYFAIGNKSALLFSSDKAIVIDNVDSVQSLTDEAEEIIQNCTQFGVFTNDAMFIKDSYQNGVANGNTSISLSSYPCLAPYVDYETMKSAVRPDLSNKDALVEIAYSHYSSIYKRITPVIVSTEYGVKKFAETGNFCEISSDLINTVDIKHRIRVLRKVVDAISNNRFYLVDKNKFTIPQWLEIEKYANKLTFGFSNSGKKNFHIYENFYAEFMDSSFVHDFKLAMEYMIQSRMVCDKAYSVQFINNLIAGLDA